MQREWDPAHWNRAADMLRTADRSISRTPRRPVMLGWVPGQLADAASAASTVEYFGRLEVERDAAVARALAAEASLREASALLDATVAATAPAAAAGAGLYRLQFPAGAIGMLLAGDADGRVAVSELRRDAHGTPLLALASGAVAEGDWLLAVNGAWLPRGATPEAVAALFRAAPRPLAVLMQRNVEARLRAVEQQEAAAEARAIGLLDREEEATAAAEAAAGEPRRADEREGGCVWVAGGK